LQSLDKTEQRGQRRAQFVTGVGDEVDAHPLDAARSVRSRRLITAAGSKSSTRSGATCASNQHSTGSRSTHRLFRRGRPPIRGPAHRARRAPEDCARAVRAGAATAKPRAPTIGGDDVSLGVDDKNRLRQRVDHRAEQRLVLPRLGAVAHAANSSCSSRS